MKNIITIFKREYLSQVKKKSFVVLTLLAPLLLLAFAAIIAYMFAANKTDWQIRTIDHSQQIAPSLKSHHQIIYQIQPIALEQQLLEALKDTDNNDAVLVIPAFSDISQLEENIKIHTKNNLGIEQKSEIIADISSIIRRKKIEKLGIASDKIEALNRKIKLKVQQINKNTENNDLLLTIKTSLSFALMYICFMFIMIYGVRVMRSVLEEKNNRVVEIIISSVKPFELMMGKILGVTAVAITQFSLWIAMTLAAVTLFGQGSIAIASPMPMGNIGQQIGQISQLMLGLDYFKIIFVFIFYFLFGYLFYSSIYAAIGASVDNETETSQFTMFTIIPLSIGLYGSLSIANNPEGPVGFWLSIIPFTSPVAMVSRVCFGVNTWELLLSMFLLIISSFFTIKLAAKIYRIGILSYGNKTSFKTMLKWLKEA
jgi:ABC-2 type transport system permease protein